METRFPKINSDVLYKFDPSNEIKDVHITQTPRKHRNALYLSLFKPPSANDTQWQSKYLNPLLRNLSATKDLDIKIFTENYLLPLRHQIENANSAVEIIPIINYSKLYPNPGALWRFLGANDSRYELIFVADIDLGDWSFIRKWEDVLKNYPKAAVTRRMPNRGFLFHSGYGLYHNYYPTITACAIAFRPKLIDYDMKDYISRFISLSLESPDCLTREVHAKYHRIGLTYPEYGFDERFLKHVVYYEAAENGALLTIDDAVFPPLGLHKLGSYESQDDDAFCQMHKNDYVNVFYPRDWIIATYSCVLVLVLVVFMITSFV
tara:strand:- start:34 stop:993 length:960 start_codon:yes stop_codon:yes gene_type:complete